MSEQHYCGTCRLDFQHIPRKFAREYQRDATRCPRCHTPNGAQSDADGYTLRRQDTAAQLAVGPLVAPEVAVPEPKVAPQRHIATFINTIAASLIAVVIVLATLVLFGVFTLQRSPLASATPPIATSMPTITPTNTAPPISVTLPTNVGTGAPTIMTIQPYAITADCRSATASATTTINNFGTTAWRWSAIIAASSGGTAPFQLVPLSGLLQPQATQVLTINQIAHAGNVVVTANGVAESIIVTCSTPTATPVSTAPPQ